eukprot:6196651-Pleurochrysis_carterae.AAC.1
MAIFDVIIHIAIVAISTILLLYREVLFAEHVAMRHCFALTCTVSYSEPAQRAYCGALRAPLPRLLAWPTLPRCAHDPEPPRKRAQPSLSRLLRNRGS